MVLGGFRSFYICSSTYAYNALSAFRDMPWRVAERSQFKTLVVFRLTA